jgi:hypothetical protein
VHSRANYLFLQDSGNSSQEYNFPEATYLGSIHGIFGTSTGFQIRQEFTDSWNIDCERPGLISEKVENVCFTRIQKANMQASHGSGMRLIPRNQFSILIASLLSVQVTCLCALPYSIARCTLLASSRSTATCTLSPTCPHTCTRVLAHPPVHASTHSSAHAYASPLTRGWGRRAAEGRGVYSNAMCGAAAGRQNEWSSFANPSPFEAAGGGEGSSLGINVDSLFDRAQKASPRYTLCFLLLARCCTHR